MIELPKTINNHPDLTDDELLEIAELLSKFFKDSKKITLWLLSPNPNFGGAQPAWMILIGRGKKLLSWMRTQNEENALKPI